MNELAPERDTRSAEQRDAQHDRSIALVAEARTAFVDERDELIEHDTMRFDDNATGGNRSPTPERAEPQARKAPVVVHRFHKRNNEPATAPRRVITLRDKRRGRPTSPTGKHGADPPV